MTIHLAQSDALHIPLPDESVHCVVTSPPYYGLRDYGTATWEGGDPECDHIEKEIRTGMGLAALGEKYRGGGHKQGEIEALQYKATCGKCGAIRHDPQIGLEETPEQYIDKMVRVFREVRRVLRADGVCWLNLGDSYANATTGNNNGGPGSGLKNDGRDEEARIRANRVHARHMAKMDIKRSVPPGLKPKDLMMIPARVALALQADGWWVRSDIIWHKPNCMPESVTDRPTTDYEHVFLLAKSARYFYDADAIREPNQITSTNGGWQRARLNGDYERYDRKYQRNKTEGAAGGSNIIDNPEEPLSGRNKRTVWTIPTRPYAGAHFATFPPDLVEPMIRAGTSERGVCPDCGAPWERVVERVRARQGGTPIINGRDVKQSGNSALESLPSHLRVDESKSGMGTPKINTTGWRPTCDHDADPVPAIVADIFAGSGTVGVVARKLGRDAVLLDISHEYLRDQARARLDLDKLQAWESGNGHRDAGAEDYDALPLFGGA